MSTLKVDAIVDKDSGNTATINGKNITDSNTEGKNIIINGAMRVCQRPTSVASVSSSGYFSTDRMKYYRSTDALVATVAQVEDAPTASGFKFSHKVTATTADSSVGNTELVCPLWYIVEKQDVESRLLYGTSSAKSITMSFWIKSNVTGAYAISAYRASSTARVQAQIYTISSANTWEYKTLTFLGDTAQGIDVDLNFYFNGLVGGDYDNTSTTSGWATYSTGNWAGGHTATWGQTTNDSWQITGLQLEVGSQATDFEHLLFEQDLGRCQRYYLEMGGEGVYERFAVGFNNDSTEARCVTFFPTTMRGVPGVGYVDPILVASPAGNGTITSVVADYNNSFMGHVKYQCSGGGLTTGDGCSIVANNNANARVKFDAEL